MLHAYVKDATSNQIINFYFKGFQSNYKFTKMSINDYIDLQ